MQSVHRKPNLKHGLAHECLGAEGGDQCEVLGVFGAGLGGVDHDAQVAAGHGEDVAVEDEGADLRVVDRLAGGLVVAGDAGVPQLREQVAFYEQFGDQAPQPPVGRVAGGGCSQVGDQCGQERGEGTIINVAGMIAFSGPAPHAQMPRRAVYGGSLAYLVAFSQTLSAELEGTGVNVQVLVPGVVATEFHERQGLDMSRVPRMTADDVVTASLRGLELGETVSAPGLEDAGLLDAVFQADLAAFGAQSTELATRYRAA